MDGVGEKIYYSLSSPVLLLSNQICNGIDCPAFNSFSNESVQPVKLETESGGSSRNWGVSNRGNQQDDLFHPKGLAIDNTDTIFVADCMNHRVQSFDKNGNHLKAIKSPLLTYPWGIVAHEEYLYITCCNSETNYLLKLCKLTGNECEVLVYQYWLAGLDTDSKGNVYACECNASIHAFDSKLTHTNIIKLKSSFMKQDKTDIWDVKVVADEFFYILCEESLYPVQMFDLKGKLLKCIVHQSEMSRGYFFCIDSDRNIVICDNQESVVRIFNKRGDLVLVLGEKGKVTDQCILKTPTGIALNSEGHIIVCDDKPTQTLQSFMA